MKKLFGKRKKEEGSAGPPASSTAGTNVPPLPLQQMPGSGYSNTGYLQSPGGAGTERSGGPPRTTVSRTQSGMSRTQSGMSSGRRSARRPREFIDLSQPEQVDGSGTDEDGSSWEGSQGSWGPQDFAAAAAAAAASSPLASTPGVSAAEQEMLDADLALAYQLAMQDQQQQQQMQPAALHPRQPQPPPPPWQQQQQQHHPPVQSMPALQQPAHSMQAQQQPPAAQQSLPMQQQDSRQRQPRMGFLSSLSLSLNSRSSMTGGQTAGSKDRSEDLAVAAALAESQFAARQQAEMDRQHGSLEAAYQAAITQALEESMVTINYDDLLREIQLWIYDLEGATSDVNKALEDAREKVAEVNRQLAEADPDDAEGWHRIVWLSEQYPLVEERLRLVEGRVAPVNTGVRGLKDLREYIRQDEPPLADAEAVRDQIISRLFEQLGNQGLDAHHPFNAFGDKEEEKRGSLRTLMSLGRSKSTDKVKAPRGGDLRDMVRQLIEEAQRIPDAPPLPVDYEQLLTDLVRWIEECEAANGDVDTAIQEVRQMLEEAEAQQGAATEDPFDPHWHRVVFLSEQYPLAEGRLIEMLERIAPTNVLAQTFRDLKQHIETSKPTLAEAEAARDAGISTLFSGLAAQGLQAGNLPPAPQTSDMRDIVAQGIEEAKRIPEVPPVPVDYSRLRVNVSEWIEQLEASNQDVLSTKLEVQQLVQQNESEKATATEDVYDEGWHRIVWLSEQYPLADGRVDAVGSQARSTVPALESLRALQVRIDGDAPPPLAGAQADLDATITTLLTELGAAGLDTASLPDAPQGSNVRQLVVDALDEAKRIPAAPPVPEDYDSLSRNIQECITELEGTTTEIVTVVEEVEAEWQANEAERAAMEEDIYDETYNRLDFNSKEGYPLVQSRLRDVANQAQPTVTAAKDLRELKRSVDAKEPRLRDAQNSLDKRLHGLVNDLGQRGVKIRWPPQPLRPKWEPRVPPGTSFVFREAVDKARRLPPPPRPPLRPASLNPPPDRPPRVWPPMVFRVPNLSEPRPRIRSRGVKPEPEDAIKRDPRVITLWGELCQTRGIVADTVGWEDVRAEAGAAAKGGGSNTPASARRPSTGGASAGLPSPRSGGKGGGGGAASTLTTPRAAWGVRAASPTTPKVTPSPPRPGTAADSTAATPAEPELSAEEEAAYLPTLAARGAAIAAFEPNSLQEVADFVADVKAQGGDVPRSGHAAVTFPRSRWRALVEAAAVFDELVEMCDTLTKWECDHQATSIAESHRLAAYMDRAAAAASRVMYAHDALRVRMQKAKLPWDDALLTDLRWASQRAAAATMQFSLDQLEVAIRRKGWNTGGILQPLGSAAIAAFKVHQFSGGFNMAAEKVYDELHERTVHYARMLDPKWLRSTKW